MGLPVRIVLYAADERSALEAARSAFARIAALDATLSDYRPDSELNRLSRTSGEWVHVSRDLFTVLRRAREIAEITGGAFDPTIGPLVALWRESRRLGRLPAEDAVADARARVGWRHLELDGGLRRARLAGPGMRLDLGGIAKGFALDEAREVLGSLGVRRVLLEAGGDIVVGDAPPGRSGWTIEVPGASADFARRAAALENAALSASGGAAQFVEIDGARYSHVVDPATGLGLTRDATVYVICPDAATSDALATAISVGGRASFPQVPGYRCQGSGGIAPTPGTAGPVSVENSPVPLIRRIASSAPGPRISSARKPSWTR